MVRSKSDLNIAVHINCWLNLLDLHAFLPLEPTGNPEKFNFGVNSVSSLQKSHGFERLISYVTWESALGKLHFIISILLNLHLRLFLLYNKHVLPGKWGCLEVCSVGLKHHCSQKDNVIPSGSFCISLCFSVYFLIYWFISKVVLKRELVLMEIQL